MDHITKFRVSKRHPDTPLAKGLIVSIVILYKLFEFVSLITEAFEIDIWT